MTPRIIDLNLDAIRLEAGAHDPDSKYGVMELVAFVAGERWSDSPACTSGVIAAFLRRWNDGMNDDDRQMLKRFFVHDEAGVWTSPLIGTAGTPEIERRRAYLAADWSSRTAAPKWLRACGAVEEAAKLEALAPITDQASAKVASAALRRARDVAYKLSVDRRRAFKEKLRDAWAAGAAWAAWDAWDAWAAGAAWDAWDAWAAWDAGAAWAILVEKLKAANALTYDEVYAIARPYFDELFERFATEKLRPVVVDLQHSALELVDRMIAVGQEA